MANPTSNFGWQMPTSTDLVTDLPADFETFGQAVDTSLADLKGGTSGQVLSKNSNTDMDFVWVTSDDANAIQNTIVDAKGDLIAASAADTPARLAVGTNGQVLTADSTAATGLKWAAASSGAVTKIATGTFTTVANTSTTFDGVFTSTYKRYMIVANNVVANSNSSIINIALRTASGTKSTAYYGAIDRVGYNGTSTIVAANNAALCELGRGSTAFPLGLTMFFTNVGNSSQKPVFYGSGGSGNDNAATSMGYYNDTADTYTGFILSIVDGTISGVITVYGLEN